MVENLNPKLDEFINVIELLIYSQSDSDVEKTFGDKGLVIAVEGKYGSGKTTFINIFSQRITTADGREANHVYKYQRDQHGVILKKTEEKKQVRIIRYDAWENDYFEDPFISLVGQICEQLKNLNDLALTTLKESALDIVKLTGSIIAEKVLGKETVNYLKEARQHQNERVFDDEIQTYSELIHARKKFKEELAQLSESESATQLKVIIVDELDRCTPTFAVKVLEMIKHFFNAANVIFIITIDKQQLISIIKKVYGDCFEANSYLQRFFDFELKLPVSEEFYSSIVKNLKMAQNLEPLLLQIVELFNFKPRELIKYCRIFKFASEVKLFARDDFYLILALYLDDSTSVDKLLDYQVSNHNQPEEELYRFVKEFFGPALESISEDNNVNTSIKMLFILVASMSVDSTMMSKIKDKYPVFGFDQNQNEMIDIIKQMLKEASMFC